MSYLNDRVLDNGLSVLDLEATHIHICSAEPTTFAQATSTYALGAKALGAGGVFGAPAARTPSGRRVSSTAITDGAVTANGTATHYAVVDSLNGRLLAASSLASSQGVSSGNTFSLPSFDIGIPGPV